MKKYNESEIFTEVSLMSSELRLSIKQMNRYYRYDVGDEIRKTLREIKYILSDIHRNPNNCYKSDLLEKLDHLEIALNDCIEDGALSLSGRYNIVLPMERLSKIINLAEDL